MTLLDSKWFWMGSMAAWVTFCSLVAAAWTRNEHWPFNILLAVPLGALCGWLGWRLSTRRRGDQR